MRNKPGSSFMKDVFMTIPDLNKVLLFTICVNLLGKTALAAAPWVAGKLTDRLTVFASGDNAAWRRMTMLAAATALLYLVGNLIDGLVQKNMVSASQLLAKRLRDKVAQKLNRLPIGYLDSHPAGDIQAIATTDIQAIAWGLESAIPSLSGQAMLLVVIFMLMFFTNWRLALIYTATLPLSVLMMLAVGKTMKKGYDQQMDVQGRLHEVVSDTCANHLAIRSFQCEARKLEAFDQVNREHFKSYAKSRFVSGFIIPTGTLINNVSFILLCLLGGGMLIRGTLTLGTFQAFLVYGNMLNSPIVSITGSVNSLMSAMAAMDRVRKLLNERESTEGPSEEALDLKDLEGQIQFEHVRFGYTPGRTLMKDVSFQAEKGMTVAIVGPSGAGKTTLVNLLMRFYEVEGGTIRIDGKDTSKLPTGNLRAAFGMVPQDAWIFDGTIAENIGYGRPDASREEIIWSSMIANCDGFIRKLPKGYDTRISADSAALSAGEMQLLAIARCVLSDARIVILDEATSRVDSRTEYVIVQAMNRLTRGQTCFIIAHRLFTIKNADLILYMMDGDIREIGTHEELMTRNGLYAKMYDQAVS